MIALTVAVLGTIGFAAPASAQPTAEPTTETCWLDADTGSFECFADREAWLAALAERGYVLIIRDVADDETAPLDEENAARGGFGTLAVYLLATLYQDINHGGAGLNITTGSAFLCSGTDYNGNMPPGWNDAVSSFESYGGCRTRLASNINQGGSFYGPFTSALSLGAFNDIASSYRVMD